MVQMFPSGVAARLILRVGWQALIIARDINIVLANGGKP